MDKITVYLSFIMSYGFCALIIIAMLYLLKFVIKEFIRGER